jgi:hypothetical protein
MLFKQLYCTLTNPVITAHGEFIPKGTPVQLIRWDEKNEGMVVVRTPVCMFVSKDDTNAIHGGLFTSVAPHALEYHSHKVVSKGD